MHSKHIQNARSIGSQLNLVCCHFSNCQLATPLNCAPCSRNARSLCVYKLLYLYVITSYWICTESLSGVLPFHIMEKSMVVQRICLKSCGSNGFSCVESLKMLRTAFGESCMSKTRTYDWYKAFKEAEKLSTICLARADRQRRLTIKISIKSNGYCLKIPTLEYSTIIAKIEHIVRIGAYHLDQRSRHVTCWKNLRYAIEGSTIQRKRKTRTKPYQLKIGCVQSQLRSYILNVQIISFNNDGNVGFVCSIEYFNLSGKKSQTVLHSPVISQFNSTCIFGCGIWAAWNRCWMQNGLHFPFFSSSLHLLRIR